MIFQMKRSCTYEISTILLPKQNLLNHTTSRQANTSVEKSYKDLSLDVFRIIVENQLLVDVSLILGHLLCTLISVNFFCASTILFLLL